MFTTVYYRGIHEFMYKEDKNYNYNFPSKLMGYDSDVLQLFFYLFLKQFFFVSCKFVRSNCCMLHCYSKPIHRPDTYVTVLQGYSLKSTERYCIIFKRKINLQRCYHEEIEIKFRQLRRLDGTIQFYR